MAHGHFRTWFVLSLALGGAFLVVLVVRGRNAGTPNGASAATQSEETAVATPAGADVKATAVVPRNGLPNFAAKLAAGKNVTIVYLGGGTTASGGARGFCDQVTSWLRAQYPQVRIRAVNAGIYRTSSAFGAARFDRDVLSAKPDLVIVDFVADSSLDGQRQRQEDAVVMNYERIARKAWTADPSIDLLFLYTMAEADAETWKRGVLPVTGKASERVAAHYGIPSITPALSTAAALEGSASWGDLFVDALTPTPRGHVTYSQAIIRALPELLKNDKPEPRVIADIMPISKNFWLYPRPLKEQPQRTPPPMVLVDGEKAQRTWDMPVVGVHWVGDAEFADPEAKPDSDEKRPVLWSLRSQSARENGRRLNDLFSLDRTRWGPPMKWFEEYRCFHGPAGLPLIETSDRQRNHLEARGDDLPIVSFVAPRDGRYVYSVRADEAMWWGSTSGVAMNIVHFKKGETRGESVGLHRSIDGLLRKPEVAGEVMMKAGDELSFCVDTNSFIAGGGASYLNTLISIGYFGTK